jgi:hypothetical protein
MPSKSRPPAAESLQDEDMHAVDAGGMHGADGLTVLRTAPSTATTAGAVPAASLSRFTGAYACAYTTPDRVSQWIEPGQVVAWPDGPPDTNWEPVPEPEPAPAVSDQNTEE